MREQRERQRQRSGGEAARSAGGRWRAGLDTAAKAGASTDVYLMTDEQALVDRVCPGGAARPPCDVEVPGRRLRLHVSPQLRPREGVTVVLKREEAAASAAALEVCRLRLRLRCEGARRAVMY